MQPIVKTVILCEQKHNIALRSQRRLDTDGAHDNVVLERKNNNDLKVSKIIHEHNESIAIIRERIQEKPCPKCERCVLLYQR